MNNPPIDPDKIDESVAAGWLHLKLGQIFAGLEDVRDAMGEMRSEAVRMRESSGRLREEVTGLVSRIDSTTHRIGDIEKDIEPIAAMTGRMLTLERDVIDLKPRVEAIEALRHRLFGGVWVFTAAASAAAVAIEIVRFWMQTHT